MIALFIDRNKVICGNIEKDGLGSLFKLRNIRICKQDLLMGTQKSPWPSAESVTARLLIRDWYASARLHYVIRIKTALVVALFVSLVGTVALFNRPPQFRYILANDEGAVMKIVPLDEANHDDDYIINWTIDATTRLYSFDFVNYRSQFQDAKANLTTQGWVNFEQAMKNSGNFNAVIGNNFVTTAVPTGPGRIIKKGDVYGRYAWKIEFPMLISYRSSFQDPSTGRTKNTSQQLTMAVTVIRQPEFLNAAGLGVRALVAE
jgi:intracellular multiplication protein IcmL